MKWKAIFAIASFLISLWPTPSFGQIKLADALTVRLGRLAKLECQCDTPVRWINLHEDLDLIADSTGKYVTLLGAKVGRYKIAAFTSGKEGPSEPAYCLIVVEGPKLPGDPAPPPKSAADPVQATGKIRFGNAGCTATVMYPRRADGKWDVLTAAHCTGGPGAKGTLTLKNGRSIAVRVVVRQPGPDICWLITEDANLNDLPFAMLASVDPPIGTPIWHNGYGVDRPGNLENGVVTGGPDSNGQLKMQMSVSSGDSGGGIFRKDSGELVACVCCTASRGNFAAMYGGCASYARKYRPTGSVESTMVGDEGIIELPPYVFPRIEYPIELIPMEDGPSED